MTFHTREFQPSRQSPFLSQTSGNGANAAGLSGVAQALTALRADDPAFSKVISVKNCEKGSIVATSDDLSSKMYVLMSGKVNLVCTNNEGRRLVIASLRRAPSLAKAPSKTRATPTSLSKPPKKSRFGSFPPAKRDMTMRYPILGWGMLQTYGERLLQVENSLEDVAYKKLPERLAMLLLDLGNNANGQIKGVSHQALADHLGTYETVSAILRDFKRQELVELGYRRITLLDAESLKDITGIWD